MNAMHGLWPGVVASYNATKRTARVRIPGVTDGSDTLPEAVFSNPLGDRADLTEIRIQAGDPVWLMFECGDARFPIITGYRTPREGNPTDWRRWAHANIEVTADGEMILNASSLRINAQSVEVVSQSFDVGSQSVSVQSLDISLNASAIALNGNTSVGGDLTNQGVNVGRTHVHGGVDRGNETTNQPQ